MDFVNDWNVPSCSLSRLRSVQRKRIVLYEMRTVEFALFQFTPDSNADQSFMSSAMDSTSVHWSSLHTKKQSSLMDPQVYKKQAKRIQALKRFGEVEGQPCPYRLCQVVLVHSKCDKWTLQSFADRWKAFVAPQWHAMPAAVIGEPVPDNHSP